MAVHEGWGVIPHLTIPDGRAAEAVEVYGRAFGAAETRRSPAQYGRRLLHVSLAVNGGMLLLHDDFPEMHGGEPAPAPSGTTLHLQVDDADAWFARAIAAGATATMPPQDMFWGDRYGRLQDPFGHTWAIGARIAGERQ